jgi:hypothetical protein
VNFFGTACVMGLFFSPFTTAAAFLLVVVGTFKWIRGWEL